MTVKRYLFAAVVGGFVAHRLMQSVEKRDLQNRVAVITGASSGIGKATAHLLAAQGMRPALIARSETDLATTKQELTCYRVETLIIPADVSSDQETQAAAEQILKVMGRIDVLINSAGLFIGGALETTPAEGIRSQIAVNLYGAIRMTQCVLPTMLQ